MRCRFLVVVLALVGAVGLASPVEAQRNALSFNVGYFGLDRLGARPINDVLVQNYNVVLFEIRDFDGVTVGGDYLFAVTEFIEASVGVNYYKRTVSTVDVDFIEDDDSEIRADLGLRIIPFTATVRIVPFGLIESFQPYFGGGVGVYNWRYTEMGDFVDPSDLSIFTDSLVAEGSDVGGLILGGMRFLLNDTLSLGGEFRYHFAKGDTGGAAADFLGNTIDLDGFNALFNVTMRF